VGVRQLVTLAVLPARKFDTGPDAVFLAALDRQSGALALLSERAAAQADGPGPRRRLLIGAGLGSPIAGVVVGVPEPHVGFSGARANVHHYLLRVIR
jgi:hypothetical protein